MIDTVEPLSNGVQIGIRVPALLIALAGMVLVLVAMRRTGVLATMLGAAGCLFLALDQLVIIVWVLQVSSLSTGSNVDADQLTAVANLYTLVDAAMITVGVTLVVAALVVPRPPTR